MIARFGRTGNAFAVQTFGAGYDQIFLSERFRLSAANDVGVPQMSTPMR